MVKNLTGGTKTKGVARKHQGKGDSRLRLPDDELEMVACVTKMLGNGMCESDIFATNFADDKNDTI